MSTLYTPELIAELKSLASNLPRAEGVKAVAKRLKLGERAARTAFARYVEGSEKVEVKTAAAPKAPKTSDDDETFEYTIDGHKVESIEDVIKICNVDRFTWASERFSVGQKANGALRWNASFKKAKGVTRQFIDELKEDIKGYSPQPAKIKHIHTKGGRLLEIAAFDLHLGKMGWSPEVGADYDIKIARTIYFAAINELVAKAQVQGSISKILLPVGNDYLTIDSEKNETTAGTRQDVDSRFSKIYREGRKILVEAIEMLRQVAPVDVVVVAGNHDNVSMFHLGDALECWFHAYNDVTIINTPISRKYYQFGKVMLCFCHGHLEKHSDLPGLAAQEQPAMWAATTYREWQLGHLHHEIVKEYMGTNVRVLSSLSGPDKYHHDNGYVGAKRMAQGFLFNENTGLDCIFQSTPVE